MAQDLKQYLAEHPCKGFKAVPHYFPGEDFVTYYHRDERCYSRRVDSLLTVYLSLETHQLVGCKIKGVRQLLERVSAVWRERSAGAHQAGLLLLHRPARGQGRSPEEALPGVEPAGRRRALDPAPGGVAGNGVPTRVPWRVASRQGVSRVSSCRPSLRFARPAASQPAGPCLQRPAPAAPRPVPQPGQTVRLGPFRKQRCKRVARSPQVLLHQYLRRYRPCSTRWGSQVQVL